jgi:hypothetical protein
LSTPGKKGPSPIPSFTPVGAPGDGAGAGKGGGGKGGGDGADAGKGGGGKGGGGKGGGGKGGGGKSPKKGGGAIEVIISARRKEEALDNFIAMKQREALSNGTKVFAKDTYKKHFARLSVGEQIALSNLAMT